MWTLVSIFSVNFRSAFPSSRSGVEKRHNQTTLGKTGAICSPSTFKSQFCLQSSFFFHLFDTLSDLFRNNTRKLIQTHIHVWLPSYKFLTTFLMKRLQNWAKFDEIPAIRKKDVLLSIYGLQIAFVLIWYNKDTMFFLQTEFWLQTELFLVGSFA